ncbi:MAG: HD domain-containing protein [Clostridia bacterium]|nr:HD domain-containing protein [Clostridia bacterium]
MLFKAKVRSLETKLVIYSIVIVFLATLPLLITSFFWLDKSNLPQAALIVGVSIVTWLSGFFVAGSIASQVLRPIRTLNEAVERFSQGDLDYQVQVEGYGEGEVSQLLTSFNNMSVTLKETMGYLNQYAADLQLGLEEKEQLMEEQRKIYLKFISSAAKAIEAKDRYTHGHTERVSEYAVKIARQLELDMTTLENVRVAAALHDIGKIGLQDDILLKPSSLTKDEFNMVKQHPVIGADILAPLQLHELVLDGVKHHHERWDGTGYPDGKSGHEISVVARIIAVADAFDAMTYSRSYRKALSLEAAIDEINKCTGSQFDPEVVNCFLQVLDYEQMQIKTEHSSII